MQRHDVRLGQQLIEPDRRDAVGLVKIRIVADVVRQHAAGERRQQRDEILPHESAADDAERAAGELMAHELFPLAVAQRDARFGHAMHERDRKGQRELRHRAAIHAAGPRQLDAAPRQRLHVDAVKANAVLADDLQLRHLRQDALVHALEPDDRAVVAAQDRHEIGAAEDLVRFGERDLGVFRAQLGAQRRVSRERSRDHCDLGHDSER